MSKYKKMTIIVVPLIYAIAMFKFYNVDYFAPDYHAYYGFGANYLWAKDGFSTLFCFISRLVSINPAKMYLSMLLLMSISLGGFVYSLSVVVKKTKFFLVGLMGIVSIGIWYYIYGKLYYDIPFSFVCYGASLVLVTKMYSENYKDSNIIKKKFYVLLALMGFCLSWKPYNIFAVAGLASLFLCVPALKKQLSAVARLGNILRLGVFFVLGWVIGNFGVLFNLTDTIKGLSAYRAHCDIQYFFFLRNKLQWDHVNDLSFNETNICFFTLLCILVIIPMMLKKWTYLAYALFIFCMFCVFIQFFSPGFPWHGFMFSAYVVTFLIFILKELETKRFDRCLYYISNVCLIFAVGVQMYFTFGTYIPKQVYWFNASEVIYNKLQSHSDDILSETEKILNSYDGTYDVHCDFKRYIFIGSKARVPVYVNNDNIDRWNRIFEDGRFVSNKKPDYIIRIYVDEEKALSNVMLPKIYNGFANREVYFHDGVRIAIYSRISDNDLDSAYGAGDCWH